MIQETPLYLLKVNLALIIFYGLYVLILRQKTFFQANRFFLLYAVYISFYLPLIEFPAHFNAPHNEQPTLINQIALPITETSWAFQYQSLQPLQYQPAMFNLTFGHLFLIVYVLGAGYFGMQLIIRLLNLKRIIQQSNRSKYGEQKALIHPKMPVSSFFSYLFWKKENEQFDYLLVGVLVQGKEFLAAIEERIKPNDFIEYLEIKSDGLTKMSGIRFQIK